MPSMNATLVLPIATNTIHSLGGTGTMFLLMDSTHCPVRQVRSRVIVFDSNDMAEKPVLLLMFVNTSENGGLIIDTKPPRAELHVSGEEMPHERQCTCEHTTEARPPGVVEAKHPATSQSMSFSIHSVMSAMALKYGPLSFVNESIMSCRLWLQKIS